MRVFVLISKSNPHADHGDVVSVFVTREKAEQHASLLATLDGCPEVVESVLVGA